MKKWMPYTPGDALLDDLWEISGLPLEELQFLGTKGLLRTYLRNIPVERYALEEWRVGLAVLYDQRMEFASLEEVRRWLNSPFTLSERGVRLCEENGS